MQNTQPLVAQLEATWACTCTDNKEAVRTKFFNRPFFQLTRPTRLSSPTTSTCLTTEKGTRPCPSTTSTFPWIWSAARTLTDLKRQLWNSLIRLRVSQVACLTHRCRLEKWTIAQLKILQLSPTTSRWQSSNKTTQASTIVKPACWSLHPSSLPSTSQNRKRNSEESNF